MTRIICRKCLLTDLDEDDFIRSLKKYIAEYPEDKRCSEDEYRRRLAICSACGELSRGMCALCGCYVEVRALKINTYCPSDKDHWDKERNAE